MHDVPVFSRDAKDQVIVNQRKKQAVIMRLMPPMQPERQTRGLRDQH